MSGYRSYPAYKESGVEWLGKVPEHWDVRRLKLAVGLRNEKVEGAHSGRDYIGLENIESWTGRLLASESPVSPEGIPNRFQAGDVLFGKLRPYLAKVYEATHPGMCTSELLVLQPREVSARFLSYWLRTDRVIRVVDSSTFGAKMPRANWEFIGSLPSVVPTRFEQNAITTFLDRETARIDATIARYERLIALIAERRQALISHAVTKGLDRDAPVKDSGVESLGTIPAHWNITTLRRIARIRYGLGQPPPEAREGLPLIRATNVDAGRIVDKGMIYVDPSKVPPSRDAVLREGDIIVVRSGAYTGDSAVLPPRYAGAVAGYDMVLSITHGYDRFYAWTLLGSWVKDYQFALQKHRAAQPHLNAEELGETLVCAPPIGEQHTIARYLTETTASMDSTTTRVREAISLLREHRTALISAAVTGKIDVREDAGNEAAV